MGTKSDKKFWPWLTGWCICLIIFTVSAHVEQWPLDQMHSRFDFQIQPRLGPAIYGTFPKYEGFVQRYVDGEESILLRFYTQDAEISGEPFMTKHLRGQDFFDAYHFPVIEFRSDKHPTSLLKKGGTMRGVLTMRNTSHVVTFQVLPTECSTPGHGCDVVATGGVHRTDYGMGHLIFLIDNFVKFSWRGRVLQ